MSYNAPPPPPQSPGYGMGPPQDHPKAQTVMILGILSLVCCQPLGIVAWIMGNNAQREIVAANGQYGGEGMVKAGKICGIIAVALLVLSIVAWIILIAIGFSLDPADFDTAP